MSQGYTARLVAFILSAKIMKGNTMEIIKTIPTEKLAAARGEFMNAGKAAADVIAKADVARTATINELVKYAREHGIAPKVAVSAIMLEVVTPCTRTKAEDQKVRDYQTAGIEAPIELLAKLAYPTGHAYKGCLEVAFAKNVDFSPSLYRAHKKEAQQAREAAHAQKVAQAEQAAKEAAAKAKTLAAKASRSKSVEAKLAAETAKVEAAKAQEAVRAVIDKAPVTQKTGGRKATPKTGPAKVLTRHEVTAHATALVAMLRSIGEECADAIAEILADNNLLAK